MNNDDFIQLLKLARCNQPSQFDDREFNHDH